MSDILNNPPNDKFIPCNGLLCCLTSVKNPCEECQQPDPVFPCSSNCICLIFSCERIGECRPKAPKDQAMLKIGFECKIVDMFIGCTSVSIDCCCDSRQSIPCNDKLLPQTVAMLCFTCLYKGQQKMVFGKKFSELDSQPVATVTVA